MRIFQTRSIRRKQTLIMMLTSSVALLLACAAFVSFETISFRKDMVQNLSTLAKIVGNNTSAALDFNDPQSSEETLLALEAQPNILGACVFSRNGDVFSKYDRPNDNMIFKPPSKSQAAGYSFVKDSLTIFEPITSKGEVIGMIYLESDMRALHTKLAQYAVITAVVFTLTLLVAFLLSARLQRLISEPILDLVQTARAVAQDKNYSIRVTKHSADEIGVLVDSFNEMLAQIQQRDVALQASRGDLERRVEERTNELAESQSLYHSLVDQMPAGIFRKDAEGRFVFINSWFCRTKGLEPDQILGRTAPEIASREPQNPTAKWRPELATEGSAHHELILRTGQIIETEEQYSDADGKVQYLHMVKSPVFDSGGKIVGTQGMLFDVTERRQAEAELSYERDLLKTLLDNFPDSIYYKDLQSRFVRVSRSKLERSFDFCRDQYRLSHPGEDTENLPAHLASAERFTEYLKGKTDFDFLDEESARSTYEQERQIIRTGKPLLSELEQKTHRDGKIGWYITTKMPWKDKDGNLIGTFGTTKDVTFIKEAEAKLEQANAQLQWKTAFLEAQVNSSIDGILVIDQEGKMTLQNQRFVDLFNIPQHIAEEKADENRLRWIRDMNRNPEQFIERVAYLNVHPHEIGRDEIELKNGTILDRYSSPATGKDGKYYGRIWTFRDITRRKRLEAQLFQSQKMETVGKLAGGFAHEFNSILTAIIGQSELLLGDLPAGSPLVKNANEINKAAGRAATLTRQLLAYGRKQILQPEILDLNSVLAGMENTLRHLMGQDTDVRIVPAAGLKSVKADAGQVEQVIMNMAINARDAMPNGGKLTLETTNVMFDQESVDRYQDLKPGDYAMLAITDTGTGMSEVVKARVFEPFFSTKGVGQGTGLGLSTCHGIIKQSGGHISVYSEPGRGTTFKIYLPKVEPQTKIPIQRLASPDLPRGTETILLAEDDPALREMAATLLRRLGYTVLTAANGVEALSVKHERSTGHIDLLFTDVVMPHMSGKELADRVRALYPHTRILFTSAYTENAIVHQGVLDKGVALLQKPFTPSALAHKVREVLDQPGAPQPDDAQETFGFANKPGGGKIP